MSEAGLRAGFSFRAGFETLNSQMRNQIRFTQFLISSLIASSTSISIAVAQAQAPAPAAPKSDAAPAAKDLQAPRDTTLSITKIVGEVGEQFVTSREVRLNAAIEQAFREKPATEKGYAIPDPSERSFAGETSKVLDEWAVYFEAKSLGSGGVSKSEVSRVVGLVQERWNSHAGWSSLEVGAEELRQMIERKLMAEDFQKLKSDPALSPISDEEALSYYKKNRMRFGTLPFSSFKENIKQFLVKSQVERRLSEWHEVLRRKYKTRNFISG